MDAHVPQVEEEQTADAATHSSKLEAYVQWSCRVEHEPRCSVSSAAKMDAMRFDEQQIFATTKEDLRQVTADVPVVMQRQVPVIQRVQRTVDASTSRVLTLQVESKSAVMMLTLVLVIRVARSGTREVRLTTLRL